MAQRKRSGWPAVRASDIYVALLRGINVGGKNKLPMRELAAVFADAGCRDIRTYVQSGNVVFRAAAAVAKRIPAVVPRLIADRFDLQVPVVLRTADEFRRAAAQNPLLGLRSDPKALHVVFLTDRPDPRKVASLDPDRSPGDSFVVRGREIFLHLPKGVARTKLSNAYFDSKLATTSTVRNWRTVQKLAEMAQPVS